jgi:hypothetical protein
MIEANEEGKSFWRVFGAILFVLVLALLFMIFSGSNLRRRWGHGHFSSRGSEVVPTYSA